MGLRLLHQLGRLDSFHKVPLTTLFCTWTAQQVVLSFNNKDNHCIKCLTDVKAMQAANHTSFCWSGIKSVQFVVMKDDNLAICYSWSKRSSTLLVCQKSSVIRWPESARTAVCCSTDLNEKVLIAPNSLV